MLSLAFLNFLTVMTPGPAVMFTLTNAINSGKRQALLGVAGVSLGAFIPAMLVSGMSFLTVSHNASVQQALTLSGIVFFTYLGFSALLVAIQPGKALTPAERYNSNQLLKGIMISVTNPKIYGFILFLMPLFTTNPGGYALLFGLIFSINIIFVHVGYLFILSRLDKAFDVKTLRRCFNLIAGVVYLLFVVLLLKGLKGHS